MSLCHFNYHSFDGVLKSPSFDEGGWGEGELSFIENNRKGNKIMHCVDFFNGSFGWAFFKYLSIYLL